MTLDIELENESLKDLKETLGVLKDYLPGPHNFYFEKERILLKEIDKSSTLGFVISLKKELFKNYKFKLKNPMLTFDVNDFIAVLEKAESKSILKITSDDNDDKLTITIGQEGKVKRYRLPFGEAIEDKSENALGFSIKKLKVSMELAEGTISSIFKDLNIGDDIKKFMEILVTEKSSPDKAEFRLYEKAGSSVGAQLMLNAKGGLNSLNKLTEDQLGSYDMDYLSKIKKLDTNGSCQFSFTQDNIVRLTFLRKNIDVIYFQSPVLEAPDEEGEAEGEEEDLEEGEAGEQELETELSEE